MLIKQLYLGLDVIVKAIGEHVVGFLSVCLMCTSTGAFSLNLRRGCSTRCTWFTFIESALSHRVLYV
jgi:hypothetical protein